MSALTMKVTLRHVQPAIWRRLRVPSAVTLADLHGVLQIALGWTDSHIHLFRVGRDEYGVVDPEMADVMDEKKTTLAQIASATPRFVYDYDLGDGWEHDVLVEKSESEGELECLDGARAIPPEDCGGPFGYQNLVEAVADRKHPEHRELKDWVGPSWKPDRFDVASINKHLRTFAARWRKRPVKPKPRLVKRATD